MFTNCNNCKKDVEPMIDSTTLVDKQVVNTTLAVCANCKQTLNLSFFMKKTLASMQRFYKPPVTRSAFSFKCNSCEKVLPPILSEDKSFALCGSCGSRLNISSIMIRAMILNQAGSTDSSRSE